MQQKITSRSGFESSKARDIMKQYGEAKGLKLINALKAKGRYYYDEEFPDDEEDSCFVW